MKNELKDFLIKPKTYGFFILIFTTVIIGNRASYIVFDFLKIKEVKGGALNIMVDGPFPKWLNIYGPAIGILFLTFVCLILELSSLGWENSSLRRLIHPKNPTRKTDIFYFLLALSGLKPVLAIGFSFGISHFIYIYSQENFNFRLLSEWHFLPAFLVVFFLNTFLFYIVHRLMHSRPFWEIHKIHHSATELNIITPHRNHPVDFAIVTVMSVIPVTILGAPYEVLFTYLIFNGIYQQLVHTEMKWKPAWLGKYIFIDSEAHKVHHSQAWKELTTNYGIIIFWDWLLGTWGGKDASSVKVGLKGQPHHNTGKPILEMIQIYWLWLNGGKGYGTLSQKSKRS